MEMLLAGMCARRRSHFLLSRQKKVTKEKATPLAVSPALRFGATCDARHGAGAACCAAAPAPRPALLGTARGAFNKPLRAIAALGLGDWVWERACPR